MKYRGGRGGWMSQTKDFLSVHVPVCNLRNAWFWVKICMLRKDLGTELAASKGTDCITSVLLSTDSR